MPDRLFFFTRHGIYKVFNFTFGFTLPIVSHLFVLYHNLEGLNASLAQCDVAGVFFVVLDGG